MRRAAALLPPLLAVLALASPAAGAPRAQTAEAPPLAAKLTACDVGPNAADRSAGFEGTMPAVPEGQVLQMRFDLQVRKPPARRFKTLAAPTFGRWVSSEPGAAGYVYDKRVESLEAGLQYRVAVRFRWRDGAGAVVKTAQRTSPICRQPDLRPDLRVTAIDVAPGSTAGRRRYTLTVENKGKGPAGLPFAVALAIGRAAPLTQTLPGLEALASTQVTFEGPACSGGRLRATADAGGAITEPNERDNLLAGSCSSGG